MKTPAYKKEGWRFNPVIKKWVDSISTNEQLSNAFDMLPKFALDDEEKKCITEYIELRAYKMLLDLYKKQARLIIEPII